MKSRWWAGTMGLILSSVSTAGAKEKGFELGLRSGYALPLGEERGGLAMNDFVTGVVPLWFDLGYRATPNVMVGAYFQYGFAFVGDRLDASCEGFDCSAHNMRLGAQVHYHFMPWESVDPWLGIGIGYEWLSMSQSGMVSVPGLGTLPIDATVTVHGFEFVNLQGGIDFMPSDKANFGLGPFVALSLAKYASGSASANGQSESRDVEDPSLHEWLTLGVRGTFVP